MRFGFTQTEFLRALTNAQQQQQSLFAELSKRPSAARAAELLRHYLQYEDVLGSAASKVELVYVGPGDRRIEVNFKDYSRTTVTGSSVTDDGSHGGIDFIVVSGVTTTGPAVAPALKAVRFIPLSG